MDLFRLVPVGSVRNAATGAQFPALHVVTLKNGPWGVRPVPVSPLMGGLGRVPLARKVTPFRPVGRGLALREERNQREAKGFHRLITLRVSLAQMLTRKGHAS
jgi:hypothetical protein